MIKILAAENVHSDIVRGLRNAGHDILYLPEIGLSDKRRNSAAAPTFHPLHSFADFFFFIVHVFYHQLSTA